MPYREPNSNKGTFGKILNVAGSNNYIGAAYLSSLAAYKTGAGYVALATVEKVAKSICSVLPEVVNIKRYQALNNLQAFDVLLIGCGLGKNIITKVLFRNFIKKANEINIPVIIDADGLNILAQSNIKIPQKCIITPHPAEAGRLLNISVEEVLKDLECSAKALSQKYNCVTVLKTHNTVICNQNNEIYINGHGNSALAKAGTGDVLAGIIAGLLAQKLELFEAAKLGVYLHSRAGELASTDLTEYSVLASELISYIPKAIKELSQQL